MSTLTVCRAQPKIASLILCFVASGISAVEREKMTVAQSSRHMVTDTGS
jgi:hypothetical protein